MSRSIGLFQKITTLLVICSIVVSSFGTIRNFMDSNLAESSNNSFFLLLGCCGCILLIVCVSFGFNLVSKINLKKQWILTVALFALYITCLWILLNNIHVKPISDSLQDIDEAFYLMSHSAVEEDNLYAYTMGIFGNNYIFVLLLREIIKGLSYLGIQDYLYALYICNLLMIVLGTLLTWLIVKDGSNIVKANKVLLLMLINPVFYGLLFWIYTSTFSLPIMMGIIYVAQKVYKCPKKNTRILLSLIEGGLVALGYAIRPTSVFPFIAICFYGIFRIIKEKQIKKYSVATLVLIVIVLLVTGFFNKEKNSYFNEVSSNNYPITYWIMIGSHGEGNYSTAADDRQMMDEFKTKEEKNKAAKESAVKNYRELGITGTANLWFRKLITTWADGYSSINVRMRSGQSESRLFSVMAGHRNSIYRLYANSYRLFLFVCAGAFLLETLKKNNRIRLLHNILILTLFGAIMFHLVWEAKDVYSASFLFVILILAEPGVDEVYSKIKNCRQQGTVNRKLQVVFGGLLIFVIAANLKYLIRTEKTDDIYRICTTNYVITRGKITDKNKDNPLTITQDFSTEKGFNKFVFLVNSIKKNENFADYTLTLSEYEGPVVFETVLTSEDVTDDKLTVQMDEVVNGGHYLISLKKIDRDKTPILFYTRYSYYLDLYEGELHVDDDTRFTSDLFMDVILHR